MLLAIAAVAAAPAAAGLAGCGESEPDPLVALAARARADAALIDSMLAEPAAAPALAGRLTPVADARRAHAQALALELGETETPSASAVPSARPALPVSDPRTALTRVRGALDGAQRQAAALVPTLPRRRAGLVGSIAASCAAHRAVLE